MNTKNYKTAPLFKDFEKPIKNFYKDGFSDAGSWKVEVKDKHPFENVFYANPLMTVSGDGKKKMEVEMGFKSTNGSQINVVGKPEDNLLWGTKWTMGYKKKEQNVELTLQLLKDCPEGKCPARCKLAHDGQVPFPDALRSFFPSAKFSAHETITEGNLEVGLGVTAAPNCFVGFGVEFDQILRQPKLKIGSRYSLASTGTDVFVQTEALKKFTASFVTPIKGWKFPTIEEEVPLKVGAVGNFNAAKKELTGEAVVEFACPRAKTSTCPIAADSSIKLKITSVGNVIMAYTLKGTKNWKASFSLDKSLKPGFTLTHS